MKFRSKGEVYRFLSSEVKAYLDNFKNMTIHHLRDLASGEREMIMADNVRFISVPNYVGLRINTMFEFAKSYPRAM